MTSMSHESDCVSKERKYMSFSKTSDEGNKQHWNRNLLFLSIALIAIGNELEKQQADENQSWE